MINPTNKDIGRRVKYLRVMAHSRMELYTDFGVIKSFNDRYVFVCFEKGDELDEWTQAMACQREQLEWVEDSDDIEEFLDLTPENLSNRAKSDLIRHTAQYKRGGK